MTSILKRWFQKTRTIGKIEVFKVTIDREVNQEDLNNEIQSIKQRYPNRHVEPCCGWLNPFPKPSPINEEQNRALIGAVEKYIYYPGDTLSGSVTLTVTEDIPAKALTVNFISLLVIRYSHSKDRPVEERWVLSSSRRILLWSPDGDANPVLSAGTHTYDFKFDLPNDMLGSVFYLTGGDTGGMVMNSVSGSLTLSHGADIDSHQVYVPIQRLLFKDDPSVRPELWAHSPEKEEKKSTGLLGQGGDVMARVTLHPGIFTTDGQDMLIDLHVVNRSRKIFKKVKVFLIQHVRFYAKGKTFYKCNKEICKIKIPVNIRARDESTMRGIRLPIPVGMEPSLDKHGGSKWTEFMGVRYEIQVRLYTGKFLSDLLVRFDDALIGSRPRGLPPGLPPGESLEETGDHGFMAFPGNFEYKTCDVRVCTRNSFCSAKQVLVTPRQSALKERELF